MRFGQDTITKVLKANRRRVVSVSSAIGSIDRPTFVKSSANIVRRSPNRLLMLGCQLCVFLVLVISMFHVTLFIESDEVQLTSSTQEELPMSTDSVLNSTPPEHHHPLAMSQPIVNVASMDDSKLLV